jgi:hypothetical protein
MPALYPIERNWRMEIFGILRAAGILALLSLIIALLPLAAGVAYALRPTEARLALLRPVSLAGLFAGLAGTLAGAVSMLRAIATTETPPPTSILAIGCAEALVPLFVSCGCLAVAWLCAALGLRRHA